MSGEMVKSIVADDGERLQIDIADQASEVYVVKIISKTGAVGSWKIIKFFSP